VVLVSKGLVNLGNTCYLNAQLECAYHIPKVRNLILEAATATGPTTAGGSVDTASAGTAAPTTDALMALQQVFAQMVSSSSSSSTTTTRSSATITPIRSFCRTLGINPLEQQDAQEFWKLLLPELDHTPLLELYQGTYDAFIKALDGTNRQRVRKEIFMDLSLDVVDYDHVMDSLQNMFTGGEILSVQDGNGWRPDKGSQETVDAIKGNRLVPEGLPKILQLHLKRFRHDWELGSVSKINDRFVFEKVLDLQSVFEDNCVEERKKKEEEEEWWLYDLQSVVVHVGEYGSGHYYAYVRPYVQKDEWYRFDDDRVTRVSFQDVEEDAFGGHVVVVGKGKRKGQHEKSKNQRKGQGIAGTREKNKVGFWKKLWKHWTRVGGGGGEDTRQRTTRLLEYGWGGRTSSAYMLQYVKRSDVPFLYNGN
jgi:ubiquitin carboxyl-terminal hydrolase 7